MDRGTGPAAHGRPGCHGRSGSATVNAASEGPLGAAIRVPSNVARTRQRPTDGGVKAIDAEPSTARRRKRV